MCRIGAVIGALIFSLMIAVPGAHGQSVPPVGGSAPSATLSADDLVNRASIAQQAKGSVRVTSVARNRTSGGTTEVIRSQGVISFTDQRYAFSSTDRTVIVSAHSQRVTVKHRREILVDPVLAQRNPQGTWHCQNIQAMEESVGGLLAVLKSGGLSVQYGTVTSAVIGELNVWDVPLSVGPGEANVESGLTLTEHVFVSQTDFTVVRDVTTTMLNLVLKQHGKQVRIKNTQTTTTNYSEYGLPVSISLPAACEAMANASGVTRQSR